MQNGLTEEEPCNFFLKPKKKKKKNQERVTTESYDETEIDQKWWVLW